MTRLGTIEVHPDHVLCDVAGAQHREPLAIGELPVPAALDAIARLVRRVYGPDARVSPGRARGQAVTYEVREPRAARRLRGAVGAPLTGFERAWLARVMASNGG